MSQTPLAARIPLSSSPFPCAQVGVPFLLPAFAFGSHLLQGLSPAVVPFVGARVFGNVPLSGHFRCGFFEWALAWSPRAARTSPAGDIFEFESLILGRILLFARFSLENAVSVFRPLTSVGTLRFMDFSRWGWGSKGLKQHFILSCGSCDSKTLTC